ncbi:alpha/beta hydrolase [Vreelandella olivaria]|uniref:alpha/beta hydrolase n=1 Tax=Vreelandella olivaria TaxID=390919 RepID=UPI00201F0FAB|nr:alpha/beta hydrolase-fold protein [Halomonas olivaria]
MTTHHYGMRGLSHALHVATLILFLSLWSTITLAQPRNPSLSLHHTVLDEPSESYRFERFSVASPDQQRHWRVTLGIPKRPVPENGFAAFWMLDGNAALMEFDARLLDELIAQTNPPLLVFVGYDNDLRIDPARTRDYTFVTDPYHSDTTPSEYTGGGADAFLEIIERTIRPEIARRIATDPAQQTLWGHSLGGLLVLHTLYTRSGAFSSYAAGSPSLWWADGAILAEPEARFIANNAGRPARVLLTLGGGERNRDISNRDMNDPRVQAHLRRIASAPSDSAATLAQRLEQLPGVTASYREFPELTHGLTLRASLMDALHQTVGISDHSNTRGTIR